MALGGDGSGDGRTIAPVAPEVVQAQCTEVGDPTTPSLTLAETGGIAYRTVGEVKAGETVKVVAEPAKGFKLAAAEGWTVNEDGTASFEVVFETVDCVKPDDPEPTPNEPTSKPDHGPQQPKEPVTDNGELAKTGFNTLLIAFAGVAVLGIGAAMLAWRRETGK